MLVGDAKLAGILAQAGGRAGAVEFVVVGVGVNVGWAPPEAVRADGTTPPALLAAVLDELDLLPGDHLGEYRRRLGTLGRQVRVELAAETFVGEAVDVDPDGALRVISDGRLRRVAAGDVVHLRLGEA